MRFISAAAMLMALILLPGPMGSAGSLAAVGFDVVAVKTTIGPGTTILPRYLANKLLEKQDKTYVGAQFSALPPMSYAGLNVDLRQVIADATQHAAHFKAWLRATYQHRPIFAISLIALIILPFLALPGLLLRGWRRFRALFAGQDNAGPDNSALAKSLPAPFLGPAWITIEGDKSGRVMPISGEMLRIGREMDNDVCLCDRSVHRYHALIHRSADATYFITDLSGNRGNGIWVNGIKQQAVELYSGDLIQLGGTDVRFERGQFARG